MPSFLSSWTNTLGKISKRSGKRIDIELEALSDIYFDKVRYDWARHGNMDAVILLAGVAVAILFIACFNYLNLAIALHSEEPKKLVCVRFWEVIS